MFNININIMGLLNSTQAEDIYIINGNNARLEITFVVYSPMLFNLYHDTRVIRGHPDQVKADYALLRENPKQFLENRYIFDRQSVHSLKKAILYTSDGIEQI